jgi:hypothetical protein
LIIRVLSPVERQICGRHRPHPPANIRPAVKMNVLLPCI